MTAVARGDALRVRLVSAWTRIRDERMAGVPILNPALAVEAVALRDWQGHWLGALVTPWFINLVLLPGGGAWRAVADRESVWHAFPSGRFEFIGGSEPGIGPYHACSLFSPVLEFADHETARETARVAVDSLFDPGLLGEPAPDDPDEGRGMSRRDFLRGASAARS